MQLAFGDFPPGLAAWAGVGGSVPKSRAAWLAAAIALAVLAAGCGGGGGGAALDMPDPQPPVAPDPQPPAAPDPRPARSAALQALAAPYESDSEYRTAWGLAQIDAATAYARIAGRDGAGTAPGAGARVAVVDTGIDLGHWEFDTYPISRTNPPVSSVPSHGTAVASVIAARRDGPVPANLRSYDFHGVAWGVGRLQIMSVALGRTDPDRNYGGVRTRQVATAIGELAQGFSDLAETDFVNMSFGVEGLVENYLGRSFGAGYAQAVRTLAQTGRPNDKAILVIAAGNDHGRVCASPEPNCVNGRIEATSPALYGGLPALEASLRSHVVAVVATDEDGRIASFSNRCGVAARWCIAAPGVEVPAAYYGPDRDDPGRTVRGYARWSGTSFAAPHVTGALAVLKHWFRSRLANEDLLARLYATAQVTPDPVAPGGFCPEHLDLDGDRSDCELSSEFGRGVMDLGAASAPVGGVSIALGERVAEGGVPAQSSLIVSGAAMGDAFGRALAGRKIAAFDALGAPFWIDAAGFATAAPRPDPAARLSRWLAGEAVRRAAPPVAGTVLAAVDGEAPGGLHVGVGRLQGAHMALAGPAASAGFQFGNTVLSTFASTDSEGEGGALRLTPGARGLALSWRPADGRADLRAGWIEETDSLFGTGAEGAFGRLSSGLAFVGASRSFEVGNWRMGVAGELGLATLETAGGILSEAGRNAFSTAFWADAVRPLAGGTLRLSLEQPLRIERGRLRLSLPVDRTPEGAVVLRTMAVGLEPSGREIDIGVDWTRAVAPGAALKIGTLLIREPGHVADRNPEAVIFTGLRLGL